MGVIKESLEIEKKRQNPVKSLNEVGSACTEATNMTCRDCRRIVTVSYHA